MARPLKRVCLLSPDLLKHSVRHANFVIDALSAELSRSITSTKD